MARGDGWERGEAVVGEGGVVEGAVACCRSVGSLVNKGAVSRPESSEYFKKKNVATID